MTIPAFPASLPGVMVGYTEVLRAAVLDSEMDVGYGRIQYRGKRPTIISGTFPPFTATQLATFETFIQTTIAWTGRFTMLHPRLRTVITVRLVFNGDSPYSIRSISTDLFEVSLSLKVLL